MKEKEIDINNENEILEKFDFNYCYNSEKCSRELCMFFNDVCMTKRKNFDKRQAFIDLGIIAITLNQQEKIIEELAELKQKAIVPKFNIGTILYMIPTRFNGLTKIKDYKLLSIGLSDIGVRYDMAVNKKESGIEPFYCASEDMFGESIFATREEAVQKLAKLKGAKND